MTVNADTEEEGCRQLGLARMGLKFNIKQTATDSKLVTDLSVPYATLRNW
jgi:hypothetical protein